MKIRKDDQFFKWVLLYMYYGGLIFAALGRYEDSYYMFERAISVPIKQVSAIALEAYKVCFFELNAFYFGD